MISFKRGAIPDNNIGLTLAIMAVHQAFSDHGYDCVITSMMDGTHSRNSLHYAGNAVDFRTRNVDSESLTSIVNQVRKSLNENYDVVHHDTHLHVEFQPRRVKGPL